MTTVYLATGSNLGDRQLQLRRARELLVAGGAELLRAGEPRETEPFGVEDQPRFLNQVLEVEWGRSARELLALAKRIETELGRTPSFRWGPRQIDVDILLFGSERIDEPDLVVPHPGLADRAYLAAALGELRPDLAPIIGPP